MNRRVIFALVGAALLHAILGLLITSVELRVASVVGVDLAAAFLLFLLSKSVKAEMLAPQSLPDAVPESAKIDEDRLESLRAEDARAASRDHERLTEQDAYLSSVHGFLADQLNQNRRLQKTKDVMESLRSSITSLNQFNENIQQNAKQVCAVAENLASTTEQGFNLSHNVQANVVTLAESITAASTETSVLLEESKKISDILTIMSDIATMTKVLSINASIVAARAGNKGKEFDVVAKEVRKLSVGTEDSLTNISFLINDIQNKVLGVSTMLQAVSTGILKEKDSMLSVAGTLQGVSLAVEIIRSITDVSGEKAAESQQALASTLTLIETALQEFSLENTESKLLDLQAEVSGLIRK